jgi:hypothetical protein
MTIDAMSHALRLLGWDGETDPVAWAKGHNVTVMMNTPERFKTLGEMTRNLLHATPNGRSDGECGILATAADIFERLGAGETIVADKETP